MATLTIKNIPDHLYQNLKNQALSHHRSINSEVIVCLEKALEKNKPQLNIILKEARRLRTKTSKHKLTEKQLKNAKEQGRL
jgi:plasmid stability protein